MLTVGPEVDKFSVQQRADSDESRSDLALTIYKEKTCFVIGGSKTIFNSLSSVSRYNIVKDHWEPGTPALHLKRSLAAACCIGDSIFVFAGYDGSKHLNSVEKLNVPAIASGQTGWELIELPEEVFAPRIYPAVVPLNESEIAILGGSGGRAILSYVVIFNVATKDFRKVADGGDYKFCSKSN